MANQKSTDCRHCTSVGDEIAIDDRRDIKTSFEHETKITSKEDDTETKKESNDEHVPELSPVNLPEVLEKSNGVELDLIRSKFFGTDDRIKPH